jgi:hypothetical protein
VFCLLQGSEVAASGGAATVSIDRARAAQQALATRPSSRAASGCRR